MVATSATSSKRFEDMAFPHENATAAPTSGVAFQAFDWGALSDRDGQFRKISSVADELASAGINAVWFPPPSQSVDLQGYMPQQWYDLEGSSAQQSAVKAVASAGMIPVADVVVNHRTAPSKDSCTNDYTSFAQPAMGDADVVMNDYKCQSSATFCSGCGCKNVDTGDNFCGCPDLDHASDNVQKLVGKYLFSLKAIGYKGFRFDMVKGYSPSFVGKYVSSSSPAFAVGEYFDGDVRVVSNWVRGTGLHSSAFDFPLRYVLKRVIQSNDFSEMYNSPGLIGQQLAANSVTFLDNHDTARNDRFGDATALAMGYAFLLTHPGTPCVFWGDWQMEPVKDKVKALIKVRTAAHLTPTSSWRRVQTSPGLYAAYIGEQVAVKLGTKDWAPDSSYTLQVSGDNFAVWSKMTM